jgi:NADH-quinone oxidoreductase subunit D
VTSDLLRPEILKTDASSWAIGPYHVALPGPMKLLLKSDGEVIVSAECETGFLHRGLEKCFELNRWVTTVCYADHLDPEAAAFGETAFCMAVEEIGKIPVPPRAKAIRIMLLELARISSHLLSISKAATAVGAETAVHYVLRDRERVLDLFELVSGVRFSLNFLRFGGVASDVTEGFIERVMEVCETVRHRLKEYNDLFTFNHAFLMRARNVGVLSREAAQMAGITGPNARASGIPFDVRKAHPYLGYEAIDFEMALGREDEGVLGDVHSRFMVRLREIAQSIEILNQVCETTPSGDFASIRVDREFCLPRGEAYARIESARGVLGCHVVSDGKEKPARVQFRVPSSSAMQVIPHLLSGAENDDISLILASLDISVAELDR